KWMMERVQRPVRRHAEADRRVGGDLPHVDARGVVGGVPEPRHFEPTVRPAIELAARVVAEQRDGHVVPFGGSDALKDTAPGGIFPLGTHATAWSAPAPERE